MNTEKIKNYILDQEMGEEAKRLYELVLTLETQYNTLLRLWASDEENKLVSDQLDLIAYLVEILGGVKYED